MGRLARLLEYVRGSSKSDAKCDKGGGDIVQAPDFQPAGDDNFPLSGDTVLLVEQPGSRGYAAAGYVDPKAAKKAQRGERRLYARDANGDEIAEIWIKNDGTISVANDSGSATLEPSGRILAANGGGYIDLTAGGTVDINGFTITPDGAATSPVSVTAPTVAAQTSLTKGGVEVADQEHDHDAGTLKDGDGAQVTGKTASSNG